MGKLAIVLVPLLIMVLALLVGAVGCGGVPGCGCACGVSVERESTPEEAAPFNAWVVVGPVLGVLVAGGVAYYLVRRRGH